MSRDKRHFLALDLGAESGRAVAGTLEAGRLSLREIHRFRNQPVEVRGTVHWDLLSLYRNVLQGLEACARRFGDTIDGIGIDTWGQDFALLAGDGTLLGNPVHYRDRRTRGMPEAAREKIPSVRHFELTGMPLLPVLAACQLLALRRQNSPLLDVTSDYLMMPDVFGYFLTGEKRCERTMAAITGLYDLRRGQWCDDVFRALSLPRSIMPELVDPGTILGDLSDPISRDTGLKKTPVIAPCTHDTASAVAAVPGEGEDWAFMSAGTWFVLGMLTPAPVTSSEALAAGLCNELSCGQFFLCHNLTGLWLLQGIQDEWQQKGESYSYDALVELASQADEEGAVIHPDDPCFLAPQDMGDAIRAYCARTGQLPPRGPGATTRSILASLALSCRHALARLTDVAARRVDVLHIVGGGSRNPLLCQFTANATGVKVVAGPVEAAAAGNVLVQALARGCLSSPAEIREVVRHSTDLVEYRPQDAAPWDDRYAKYLQVLAQASS